MMSDHTFCRCLLKTVRQSLTNDQKKRLRGAWSWRDGFDAAEFQVPSDGFYWYGSAHCSYDARQQGISAWLSRYYDEDDDGNPVGSYRKPI